MKISFSKSSINNISSQKGSRLREFKLFSYIKYPFDKSISRLRWTSITFDVFGLIVPGNFKQIFEYLIMNLKMGWKSTRNLELIRFGFLKCEGKWVNSMGFWRELSVYIFNRFFHVGYKIWILNHLNVNFFS